MMLELVKARQAARDTGFGYDADLAAVIRALAESVYQREAEILQIEDALGGCRPELIHGSRVGNVLAYIKQLRSQR